MNFTNETLIQIYLDGSFTEEAQAEFDKLMRENPHFAEQVTSAVAQRLGPAPESMVDGVAAHLDGKISGIWQQYKPSPFKRIIKGAAKAALVVAAATGLVWGWKQVGPSVLSSAGFGNSTSQQVETLPKVETVSAVAQKEEVQKSTASNSISKMKAKGTTTSKKSNLSASTPLKSNGVPVHVAAPSLTGSNSALDSMEPSVKKSTTLGNVPPQNQQMALPAANGSTSRALSKVNGSGSSQEGFPLTLSIETQKTQKVTVTVLDSKGLMIRHLYRGVYTAGEHLVDWDGKDELGNMVLPGHYNIVVNKDGKSQSKVVTVQPYK